MLTLFVPIISVLLIYIYAEHSIDTQITESSKKSLNQFFSAIDTTVEEMRDICISLLNNNQCSLYAYYTQYKPQKNGLSIQGAFRCAGKCFPAQVCRYICLLSH